MDVNGRLHGLATLPTRKIDGSDHDFLSTKKRLPKSGEVGGLRFRVVKFGVGGKQTNSRLLHLQKVQRLQKC
jgi:hypothetical protein